MKKIFLAAAAAFSAIVFPACTTVEPGPLRVATFNIRVPVDKGVNAWEERLPRIHKIVADNNFHVFGIQEMFRKSQHATLNSFPGFKRVDGNNPAYPDLAVYDVIFYRPERLELLDQGVFALSETPDVPKSKSWNTNLPRETTWAKFRDKSNGKVFFLYNTHLDHRSVVARRKGTDVNLAHINANAGDLPVILLGDFNAPEHTDVYRKVAARMNDSRKITETPAVGPYNTYSGYSRKTGAGAHLDYIFVSPGTRVLSYRVIDTLVEGQFPSDHYPVMVEIELK